MLCVYSNYIYLVKAPRLRAYDMILFLSVLELPGGDCWKIRYPVLGIFCKDTTGKPQGLASFCKLPFAVFFHSFPL